MCHDVLLDGENTNYRVGWKGAGINALAVGVGGENVSLF